ncbi:uncharacterized protein BDR25DRAFT_295138 [Lindgomyces ingoldianus]|uniref:Uncharacterized protein n=1 Tax=Lindgomyces ingoldianus TaxID=673940 RepID=A0ACB6QF21_9PLEO|nr:uncharacterized protein BDR25DRAFT_295138 [Lindgomyces ingoldianus]KAF2465558.1 hypothetical protein BDR25DRAFT_295138 [Lindgomyces ingoldianus]
MSESSELQPNKTTKDTQIASSFSHSDDDEGLSEQTAKLPLPGPHQQKHIRNRELAAQVPNSSSSGEEDDLPVRSNRARRLITRKDKSRLPQSSPSATPRSRRSSRGLFVSPTASPITAKTSKTTYPVPSDSDDSVNPRLNADLMERTRKIRAERKRLQKEQHDQKKQQPRAGHDADQESDSDPDGENGRRLTQQSKPTRKASKKAMEEMAREQQRINRNMQLTHQAKTKKRHGIKDLFAKLGYNHAIPEEPTALSSSDANSPLGSSDVEGIQAHDTPPTSPPSQENSIKMPDAITGVEILPETDSLQEKVDHALAPTATTLPPVTVDKGKGRALDFQNLSTNPLLEQEQPTIIRNAQLNTPKLSSAEMVDLSDSEDDIEVMKPKSRFPVFDNLPKRQQQEAPSLLHLRHLAHLTSPSKTAPKGRRSMNATELQMSLGRRARQQAQKEREEKIADLKRRGIHVETEEEREKHQLEIEDMVVQIEKARQEDLKLRKIEREEAKKNGETGDLMLSSDEDEDYVGDGEEEGGELEEPEYEAELELSGSEEEDVEEEAEDEDEEMDEDGQADNSNGLLDPEACEDGDESEECLEEDFGNEQEMEDEPVCTPTRKTATRRARNVVVDDEDESEDEAPKSSSQSLQKTQATQVDEMAAFGFNSGTGLGLTQVFAGTMANLESNSQTTHPLDEEPEQDSLDFLRSLPDTQPLGLLNSTPDLLVPNSQEPAPQAGDSQASQVSQIYLGFSQLIGTSPNFPQTQLSEMPEPTQDAGFELSFSPAGLVPLPSTINTVMLPIAETPVVQRRGRLQRRKDMVPELSFIDEDNIPAESEEEETQPTSGSRDAFDALKQAAKKQRVVNDFNKKTSWAKDVVEEQAEESEDEYAGIGGASDDDSGEDDEELAKMIDINDVKVDERRIAAYYAEKAKADDEKNINQLYKDIMSGALRKGRGGGAFDVSDDEDEAEQRRRKKQQEFQLMRKALVADERIGKLAENPKQMAFFRTLEDHEDDQDFQFLDAPAIDVDMDGSGSGSGSQSNSAQEGEEDITVPDSQSLAPTTTAPINPLKRKAPDAQDKENRPPPHARRTAPSDNFTRKPISFADVQQSVLELLDEPNMVPESSYTDFSDSGDELPAPIKPAPRTIIDRLSLSRSASLSSTPDTSRSGNVAFHAPSAGAHQPGFRVPSLVRKATSNISTTSERSSGFNTPVEGGVRRGGTGRSNIHAQAREAERRAKVEKVERKRKEQLKRKVGRESRAKRSVLGSLDGGFE